MTKENRIFVLGFFWTLLGAFVAGIIIADMINVTWERIWYEYVLLIAGITICLYGLRMLRSVT